MQKSADMLYFYSFHSFPDSFTIVPEPFGRRFRAFLGDLVEILPSRTGNPQWGHMMARSLIWPEHSGQCVSAT